MGVLGPGEPSHATLALAVVASSKARFFLSADVLMIPMILARTQPCMALIAGFFCGLWRRFWAGCWVYASGACVLKQLGQPILRPALAKATAMAEILSRGLNEIRFLPVLGAGVTPSPNKVIHNHVLAWTGNARWRPYPSRFYPRACATLPYRRGAAVENLAHRSVTLLNAAAFGVYRILSCCCFAAAFF